MPSGFAVLGDLLCGLARPFQNLTQFSDNKELKQQQELQQQQEQGKQRRQEIELAQNYKNNNYKLHLTINANTREPS